MEDFLKPKIIYREIGFEMDACIIPEGWYINNKLYFITGDDIEYLLAYLNSKAFNKVILASANLTGGKGVDFMEKVFAPADYELKRRILSSMEERERDEIFNGFFGFTDEETAFLSC